MAKKTSPSIPNMTSPGRGAELLRALNAAAASLQRVTHSEAEIFRAFREQVVALGLRGGISLLDETSKRLTLRAVAYPDQMLNLLAELEKLTGLKLDGFEFAVADVDAYQQAVETGQAVFVPNSNAVVAQLLPQAVRPFAGRLQQAFGAPPAVFAPLISEGRVEGILSVGGAGLTRDDVSAVQAFANHLAVRLDNARAVSALQESEARYRVLFEQSPNGILLIDAETGKTLEANETAHKQLGYTREEFAALRISDYEALEKSEETAKHMQKVMREGVDDFETLHRTKSGGIRNVHVWVKTLLLGDRVLFYAIFQDITERKQAEEETRLLLALTQAINEAPSFDSALRMALQTVCESTDWDMGETWIPRADGSALELSPVWYGRRPGLETFSADGQSFVFPPGKGLPGRVWVSRQPEWLKDVSVDGEIFPRAALALKASIKSALAVPTLAGDQMLVLVFFMQEAREGDERLVKIVSAAAAQLGSLFQRKRAEERLCQSESSLRESQIIAGLGSYVLDFSTGMWKSSGILDEIFGIDETYVRSVEGWADRVHPAERQQMIDYFTNEVIGKRVRFDKEYKIIRKNDQAERWVHGVGELEVDAQNQLLKMRGTITDITERKQAEVNLRLQATALDAAANAVCITDREGVIQWANPAFSRITGFTAEQAVGRTPRILKSGLYPREFYEELWRTILAGDVWQAEMINRHRAGGHYTVQQTITPLRGPDGEITHFVAIQQDITERVRAEAALRESEERSRVIVEAASDVFLLIDEDSRITFSNPAVENVFGFARDEILGQSVTRLMPEDLPPSHLEALKRYLNTGRRGLDWKAVEVRGRHKSGREFPIELSLGEFVRDGKHVFAGIIRDISERKRAEEALAWERNLLRAVIDNVPDFIYTKDSASRFMLLNRAAAVSLGLPPEDVVGKTDFDFHPPELAAQYFADEQTVMQSGQPLIDHEEQVIIGGQERWMLTTTVPLHDSAGRVTGLVGIARDITERKQRERELQAVVTVSAALRTAQTPAEMMPIILDQLLDLLKAGGAALVRHDDTTGESVVELVRGALPWMSGLRLPAGAGISGYVISRGQPYLTDDLQSDPRFAGPDVNFGQAAVACWPLIGQGQIVGALWVSRAQPFTENEQRLLSAISDITANALRRASLHEQTEQRLQYLTALRAVDMAISSSFDLRMTLGVLLGQTLDQLRVDAADILLLNPAMQTLDYAAGRGFRGSGITRSHLRLGECQAGRAALERRAAYLPNLAEETAFVRAGLLAGENFVAHYVTPLIAKGEVKGVLEVFQRAPLAPDPEWLDFFETLAGQAAIAIDNSELFEGLQRSNMELALAYDATIEGWSRALDLRDKETEGHTQRVTEMTLRLAHAMGLSAAELVHVRRGALLHDMGKLGVPDYILLKPGPLTDEEWVVMRKHPVYVYDLLSPIVFLRKALDIPHYHHEKWDGTGYPRGLKGELIPLTARIFAVVDVWDALRSDRPYRPAWPEEKVRDHLREQAGRHFDPAVVEAFLKTMMEA